MRLAILFCLAMASPLLAAPTGKFLIRSWQSENGLPGNVVRSVVQDNDGFLWVATAEGIVRFDGIEFASPTIPPDIILPRVGPTRLFCTSDNAIWLSSYRGGLFQIKNGTVHQILEDGNKPRSPRFTQVTNLDRLTVIAQRGDQIWNVSADPPALLAPPPPQALAALAADLELRSSQGRILPDGTPAPLIDLQHRHWTPGNGRGLEVRAADGSPITLDLTALDGMPVVSELLEDRDGNIWIASAATGLIRIHEARAQVFDGSDGLADRSTTAVLEDASGDFWIGSRHSGVDRISGDSIQHFEFDPTSSGPHRPVGALYLDRANRLWAGARDGTVFRWDGTAFENPFFRQADPSKVEAIYQDSRDILWFGGARGLVRLEDGIVTRLGAKDGVPAKHITTMSGDITGRLWFGTNDGRIFRDDNDQIVPVGDTDSLGGRRITSLHVINSSHAWAATLDNGLHFWDGSTWHRFDKRDGLPDPRLTSILADSQQNLWLGSLGGIFRIKQTELLARIRDPEAPLHWLHLDRSDGLPTRECNGSAQPAGWRSRDGLLWFPTARGLVRIDPTAMKTGGPPPPVFLRGVSADGHPLPIAAAPLITGPGRTRLEFSYHGLELSSPEKTSYRTRLLGLDKTWIESGTQREISYAAVPPGRYTFEVRAINGDGTWSDTPASIDILVRSHFWETRWFLFAAILSVITAAGSTGWFIARGRMKRRIAKLKLHRAREAERARIARDLHDDLGASVTEISLLAALGAEQDQQKPLQLSLEEIATKTVALASSLDEIVWAVNPREDTLQSLVQYLAGFCEEFLSHARIPQRFEITRNLPLLPVDSSTRHSIFLAFREACNNLVRHSGASNARLTISWDGHTLSISLQDDGHGMPQHIILGDGLGNLRSRMQSCDGRCEIESTPESGTTIRFIIPLSAPPKPPN